MTAAGILVAGCGGAHRDDRRLALADSLMWGDPDSALAIVRAVSPASLTTDADRAYRALLLTQASYRCYVPLTSDSLISASAEYYRTAGDRERYTRSLLYTGAAHEDMGNPVEAMRWYKLAEAAADTADYRNLAQLNMRMGVIYYDNYAGNNLDLEKFKRALKYYKLLDDRQMQMTALGYIGCLYRNSNKPLAIKHLKEALKTARSFKDTSAYCLNLSDLSLAYLLDSNFVEAKETALLSYNICSLHNNGLLFNLSSAYAELNQLDSACCYLAQVDTLGLSDYDRMMLAFTKSRILRQQGDEKQALAQINIGTEISDSIGLKSKRSRIYELEQEINDSTNKTMTKVNGRLRKTIYSVSVVFAFAILILILYFYISDKKKRKLLNNEIEQSRQITEQLIVDYENRLAQSVGNNESVKEDISDGNTIVTYLNESINTFVRLLTQSRSVPHKDFIGNFETALHGVRQSDNFWNVVFMLANKNTNGLIDELAKSFPVLTESDIRIIGLVCLGYNNDAVAVCMGEKKDSIKTRKNRIKNKMNLSQPLASYIKEEIAKRKA